MNKRFDGWLVVKQTPNFSILHDPKSDPLDKETYSYQLVYKLYGTVEASANSIILISTFLSEAEQSFSELNGPKKESGSEEARSLN